MQAVTVVVEVTAGLPIYVYNGTDSELVDYQLGRQRWEEIRWAIVVYRVLSEGVCQG
jgi:hypothetical protein